MAPTFTFSYLERWILIASGSLPMWMQHERDSTNELERLNGTEVLGN